MVRYVSPIPSMTTTIPESNGHCAAALYAWARWWDISDRFAALSRFSSSPYPPSVPSLMPNPSSHSIAPMSSSRGSTRWWWLLTTTLSTLSRSRPSCSRHFSTMEATLPPSCFFRVIRSFAMANRTSPVMASAAQRLVSWEYLLRPRTSRVPGGAARGGWAPDENGVASPRIFPMSSSSSSS